MISFFPSRAVAVELFGFGIHWYGIMYLLAFVLGSILLPKLQRFRKLALTKDEWLSILTYAIVGVVVGGRLGYVLFYEPAYFLAHPFEILAVWNGGMSFHGGLLGVALMVTVACRRKNVSLLRVIDVFIVPTAIGLALGRVGNFINQELYGIPTSLPWGIEIPGVEGLRHPTQLYAVAKDLLIAAVCFLHLRSSVESAPGRTGALFLMLYGVGRFLVEFLRVQQYPPFELGPIVLTRGQLLTLPMVLAGLIAWGWLRSPRRPGA